MLEWISLDLVLSVLLLVVGSLATIVTLKYKEVVNSLEKLISDYKKAMEDGKLTDGEKKQLAIDSLDLITEFVAAFAGLKWMSFIVRRKK